MRYYNLLVDEPRKILSTPASSREAALAMFGQELGLSLSLDAPGEAAPAKYLLGESDENPHWVNPTIPVFEISG